MAVMAMIGKVLEARIRPDDARRLDAVHHRHLHVHQHDVVVVVRRSCATRYLAILREIDEDLGVFELADGDFLIDLIVLDQQHARSAHAGRCRRTDRLTMSSVASRSAPRATTAVSNRIEEVTGLMSTFSKPHFLGLLQHLLAAIGGHHHEMRREHRGRASARMRLPVSMPFKPRHLPVDEGDLVALVELATAWRTMSMPSSPEAASSATKVMLVSMPDSTARACGLSSMMSTRRPRKSDWSRRGRGVAAPLPRRAVKRNVLPLPGSLCDRRHVPPISSVSCLEMARPSPVPPYLRVVEASACSKAWNRRADLRLGHADAGVAHRELDELAVVGASSSTRTSTTTSPFSVNLTALLQKLIRIWPSRSGSPRK